MNPLEPSVFIQNKNYVFLLKNHTFATLDAPNLLSSSSSSQSKISKKTESAFQIIKKKLSSNRDYAPENDEDYNYDDDEDYDDTYDYDQIEGLIIGADQNDQTIINCQADLIDSKNQFITLNYYPNNIDKLFKSVLKKIS